MTHRFEEAHPGDEPAVERLLSAAFGVPPGGSFYDDFPVWSPSAKAGRRLRVIARGSASVLACAFAREVTARAAAGGVVLIGGVATVPAARGLGLATDLTQRCLEWARTIGAEAAYLWGSELKLYRNLGFSLCGEQYRIAVEPGPSSDARIHEGWTPGIFELRRACDEGLSLSDSDLDWFRAHQGVRWFWSGTATRPSAYVGVDRGIDLAGIAHEWGGEPAATRALLGRVAKVIPGLQLIGSRRGLGRLGCEPSSAAREDLALGARLGELPLAPEGLWFWGLDGC